MGGGTRIYRLRNTSLDDYIANPRSTFLIGSTLLDDRNRLWLRKEISKIEIKKSIVSKQYLKINMFCPLFGDFNRHTFPTNSTCVWVWIIASFISTVVFPNAFKSWWALNSSKSTTSTNRHIIYLHQKNCVGNETISFYLNYKHIIYTAT